MNSLVIYRPIESTRGSRERIERRVKSEERKINGNDRRAKIQGNEDRMSYKGE
jgi:hypothetical protein